MANCGQCGQTILFGGRQDHGRQFCNDNCLSKFNVSWVEVPVDQLDDELRRIHDGQCPKCGGPGPVDLHHSYRVISAMVISYHSAYTHLTCRRCARKAQGTNLLISLLAGWWSFHGLFLAPLQIGRNLWAMFHSPEATQPSAELRESVRAMLAKRIRQSSPGAPAPAIPTIPAGKATIPQRSSSAPPPNPSPMPANQASVPQVGQRARSPFADLGNPLRTHQKGSRTRGSGS